MLFWVGTRMLLSMPWTSESDTLASLLIVSFPLGHQ